MMNRRQPALLASLAMIISGPALADDTAPPDGRIGYVMTNLFWSVYQTDDAKEECPRGFNDGPREQFAVLFPDHESMTVEETQAAVTMESYQGYALWDWVHTSINIPVTHSELGG